MNTAGNVMEINAHSHCFCDFQMHSQQNGALSILCIDSNVNKVRATIPDGAVLQLLTEANYIWFPFFYRAGDMLLQNFMLPVFLQHYFF